MLALTLQRLIIDEKNGDFMIDFTGMNEGCPRSFCASPNGHGGTVARFEANGKPPISENDTTKPDAIRVFVRDDYEGSAYQDLVLAFGPDSADRQRKRNDSKIVAGDVIALTDYDVTEVSRACGSCSEGASNSCPALEAVLGGTVLEAYSPLLAAYIDSYLQTVEFMASAKGQEYSQQIGK